MGIFLKYFEGEISAFQIFQHFKKSSVHQSETFAHFTLYPGPNNTQASLTHVSFGPEKALLLIYRDHYVNDCVHVCVCVFVCAHNSILSKVQTI